jgi:hypothetical protein
MAGPHFGMRGLRLSSTTHSVGILLCLFAVFCSESFRIPRLRDTLRPLSRLLQSATAANRTGRSFHADYVPPGGLWQGHF